MLNKKLIAVCTTNASDETVVQWLITLHKSAVNAGYRLVIFTTTVGLYDDEPNYEGDSYVFQNINYDHFDAVISFSEYIKDREILKSISEGAAAVGIPFFSIDRHVDGCIDIVLDYATAFEKLVRHVVEHHKCKKINFISGIPNNSFSMEREDIYKKVLSENGIPFEEERLDYGYFWEGPTERVLDKFLAADEIPEAIICANDAMALAACDKLEEKGYSVPEDVIVTGLDGLKRGKWSSPRLTTCSLDFSIITELIMKVIDEAEKGIRPEKSYTVSYDFNIEESCGCKEKTQHVTHKDIFELDDFNMANTYFQKSMYEMQTAMAVKESVVQLASVIHRYMLADGYIIVKNSIPEFIFGNRRNDEETSTMPQSMRVLVRRKGNEIELGHVFSIRDIVPDLNKMVTLEYPLLVMPLHSAGKSIGYMAFSAVCEPSYFNRQVLFNYMLGNALEIFKTQKSLITVNRKIEEINERMAELYIRDPLTTLFNRRGFYNNIPELISECVENDWEMFVASIDLDELKPINDTHGHSEGDNAIKTIANALAVNVHKNEICARFGGDEFVVAGIARNADESAKLYIKNVEKYLENYNRDSGKPYKVVASVGLCVSKPNKDTSIDSYIIRADRMMYENKKSHKQFRSKVRTGPGNLLLEEEQELRERKAENSNNE